MANIWDEFDKAIDTEGLAKDVEEAAENGGRREVPHDTYEVAVTKLELVKSKKGDPMVTCWMKILEGEYKGSLIFMNQVVTQGFQIHIANEFLRCNTVISSRTGSGRSVWFMVSWGRLALLRFTTRPGTPTTVDPGGTSLKTTLPAPIFELSPMVKEPSTFAPALIMTLLPMVG